MPDYVVYHNPDKRGFSAAECKDFRVLTSNTVPNEVIGSRIWLLTGEGRPRKYYLASTFIAENVTHDDVEGFQNCISAAIGQMFRPMIRIDEENWFPDFLYHQGNFAFGFGVIREEQVVNGLRLLWNQPAPAS